ncbi:hypothetical protein Isop_3166 [Isosphaera pallida ATCC 43644]|uniref:Uncharacterized protein n=1 Tax=Isosphaera pallida (strain ATCC 43644 / DSM 9630 / IS1B) TaxID=575540 RepID=E8R400_ISOPI|nr:hypothetical protein Isop_3166 [Isosphaera pallida ATCC 43644]
MRTGSLRPRSDPIRSPDDRGLPADWAGKAEGQRDAQSALTIKKTVVFWRFRFRVG